MELAQFVQVYQVFAINHLVCNYTCKTCTGSLTNECLSCPDNSNRTLHSS